MLNRLVEVKNAMEDLCNLLYSGAVVLKLLGLKTPLHKLKNIVEQQEQKIVEPESFCLCRLYL